MRFVPCHGAVDDSTQIIRRFWTDFLQGWWITPQDSRSEFLWVGHIVGRPSREKPMEHDPHGVDIAPAIEIFPGRTELFGTGIGRRTQG